MTNTLIVELIGLAMIALCVIVVAFPSHGAPVGDLRRQ